MTVSEFPDALAFFESWLDAALARNGYPAAVVSAGAFNAQPGEYVWMQRDGGAVLDVAREAPRLRVNVLSDRNISPFTARVRSLILSSAGQGPVRRVRELSGPVGIPNVKPWRYMLFEVTVVGSPVTLV